MLERLCETPGNLEAMVFNAHVDISMREIWHGRVMQETPLFTTPYILLQSGDDNECQCVHGDNVTFATDQGPCPGFMNNVMYGLETFYDSHRRVCWTHSWNI